MSWGAPPYVWEWCPYCGQEACYGSIACLEHADLPRLDPAHNPGYRRAEPATIQAVDTDDDTLYVLRVPGADPITAYWPHPLLAIEPDAVWLPSYGETRRQSYAPVVGRRG